MIAISVDISGCVADLNKIQREQLPYAEARALTKVAQDGQYAVRKRMFDVFTIRNTFTQAGVVITPATKQNLYAEVIARPGYLNLQDTGGEKIAHGGHIYLAIPIRDNLGIAKSSLIPTRLRPSNLIQSGKGFFLQLKDGRHFIFMRTDKTRTGIIPVYTLVPHAAVKAVLEMETTVTEAVQKNFELRFAESMAEAVSTAK